ncbi:serine/threonine protein kinase [Myxococcus stipitatus DSM 14675]|uniref:Serine/threonine protein kinase n=1 Tax=Myxococcus stipitatus (strain DSM 14675 / JCM 12634 / Mx s8) TaxID=1278073 RepID=L7U602_MYXSD|nr:serine/threonine-protein kinase [Myxococcus stipitatus]AGC44301.1 serine/threonine protein kinase [Myxococcus stipitatus DSM 14675]
MNSPQTAVPFGKYLLIKRLAVGGMAELFLSQRPPDPELVVLKRILPYLSEEPEFVQMFLDEARIAAQLCHPNIVQVHELGKEGDNIFIAMEYVAGVDLRRVVAEEAKFGATVPCGVAARICGLVAHGLEYAHQSRGVDGRPLELIHRDISPQNVMIGYDGRVKLVDFGIAKAGAFMERSKPGVIKGKFLYLAPEQVSQERLDHRADIFALGTMLYEITTGKQPFAKPTTEGILYAIRFEDPTPPHLLRPDYPEELSRIIMKCLTKDRTQRYPRAAVVAADLEAFLDSGALRQSLDVADYIARLLGEEEERTILHIPVPKPVGRTHATLPLAGNRTEAARPAALDVTAPTLSATGPSPESSNAPSPGLTARPMPRRTSGDALPAVSYADEPEPATQMARPRELSSRGKASSGDVADPEMATAVRTSPTGLAVLADERDPEDEDAGDGESTIPQRGKGRTPMPPATPPRRSSTHSELASSSPPRRNTHSELTSRAEPPAPPPRRNTQSESPRAASAADAPTTPPRRTGMSPVAPLPSARASAQADAPALRTPSPSDLRARRNAAPASEPSRGASTPWQQDPEDNVGEMTMPIRRPSRAEMEAAASMTIPMRRLPAELDEPSESISMTTPMRRISSVDVEASVSLTTPMRRLPAELDEASESVSLTTPMRKISSVDVEASVSITPPAAPPRRASRPLLPASRGPAVGDDEDALNTDSRMSSHRTEPTDTLEDEDDDESTMGYEDPDTYEMPPRRHSRWVMLAVVVGAVILVLGGLVIWATQPPAGMPKPMPAPDLSRKVLSEKKAPGASPVRPAPQAPSTPKPGPQGAAPSPAPEPTATAPATPAAAPTPTPTNVASAPAAAVVAATPPQPGSPVNGEAALPPQAPALVEVFFEAPPKTVLKGAGGERLPVNRLITLPPGSLRVEYDCPGRRAAEGAKSYLIKQVSPGPLVLSVPCKGRR